MDIRDLRLCMFALLALGGCASTPTPAPQAAPPVDSTNEIRSKLVGTWQYLSNGASIEVIYTPTTVTLPGVPPTPYTLVGNEITVDILGPKTSIIEFRGKDEMTQTNKTDGQRYVFKRKPSA
ncbi:MAG: hypothetical protein ABW034_12320 [Steroidobacteraceae bacterium]